ncbi:MAG TPA: hypothetical protein VFH23_09270, partial [Jiangellaceae bacterium]|nr:hypothetical protein [Jiangellaceae bacterium]
MIARELARAPHEMSTVRICEVRRRLCGGSAEFRRRGLMPGGGARIVRLRSMWGRRVRTGAVGVATIAAVVVLMVACESSDDGRIRSVSGEPSWRLLGLGIDTCNADLSADVEETAEEVRIRVHAENNTTDDCGDLLQVTLDDALGNRRV